MKRLQIITISLILILISCGKEDRIKDFTGDYSGIKVLNSWSQTTGFTKDSSNVVLSLNKIVGSKVKLSFNNLNYTFKYKNGSFKSTEEGHIPFLEIENDSLYFRFQPGNGYYFTQCYATKN